MNERLYVENAKVLKKGKFNYGNNDKGAWATIYLKVEWKYDYVDDKKEQHKGTMSAVVKLTGDNAVWARDNVTEGNPYAPTPVKDTYLNLWIRTYGEFNDIQRKDGQGTWEDISNTLVADYIQPATTDQQ